MSKFSTGGDVKSGSGGVFLTLDRDKATTAWLLIKSKDEIRWTASQASCFVKQGKPCNASWVSVGKEDPAHELGLKTDGYVAWIPVAIKNAEGGFEVKLWQTNKTNHAAVADFEKEWDMFGLRLKIAMINGRWNVSALPPHASGPKPAQLDELVAQIPNDEALEKLVGPDDANGVWELLMKRLNVTSAAQVRTAFGVANKAAGTDVDIEVEDV